MQRRCFNCDDSCVDLLYSHVESIVQADAGEWLDYDGLDFIVVSCPYCTLEDDDVPRRLSA